MEVFTFDDRTTKIFERMTSAIEKLAIAITNMPDVSPVIPDEEIDDLPDTAPEIEETKPQEDTEDNA